MPALDPRHDSPGSQLADSTGNYGPPTADNPSWHPELPTASSETTTSEAVSLDFPETKPEITELLHPPTFKVAMRGYERTEVDNYLYQCVSAMEALSVDCKNLMQKRQELFEQNENLEQEIIRLSRAPIIPDDATDRMSTMMRLARDEAQELRTQAEEYANQIIVASQKQADERVLSALTQTRETLEAAQANVNQMYQRLEANEKRSKEYLAQLTAENEATIMLAQSESQHVIAQAITEREFLNSKARKERERKHREAEEYIRHQREVSSAAVAALEARSTEEAQDRISLANSEAEKITAQANNESERLIKATKNEAARVYQHCQHLIEGVRTLRGTVLDQLKNIHEQLYATLPQLIAQHNDDESRIVAELTTFAKNHFPESLITEDPSAL